ECGLDYYHCNKDSKEKQKEVFIRQIELANEVDKPLMLHIRNSPNLDNNVGYFIQKPSILIIVTYISVIKYKILPIIM
ncbi:MAG TPA: TatD family hydrolase, partial [Tenuifilaceae bacterium]|nr:TatD family hydrolase [Tenuifilaceae bacterium]